MDQYDPATAGRGQVYGSGGRQWQQGGEGLQEIDVSGGRARAAQPFVPANMEFASSTLASIDKWISNAAATGRGSDLIQQVAPLKQAFQAANKAMFEARRNKDGKALADAEDDLQNAVDNIVEFGNDPAFTTMANEAAMIVDEQEREQEIASREVA